MPDIFSVVSRRWQLMVFLSLTATVFAFIACLLSPKKYLGITTALPSNSVLSDKARIFNPNIEGLYPELGSPDELDKIEGTAKLDTIYLAVAKQFNLAVHYQVSATDSLPLVKAATQLQNNTKISRNGYGQLVIKVWDVNRNLAPALANALLQELNSIHQQLQTKNYRTVLQRLQEEVSRLQGQADSAATNLIAPTDPSNAQLLQYRQLIGQYIIALQTMPPALVVVEPARAQAGADKPKTLLTVLLSFLASLLFSFLLVVYLDSRPAHTA